MKRVVTLAICVITFFLTSPWTGQAAGKGEEKAWKFVVLCDTRSDPCKPDGGVAGVNADALGKIAAAVAAERPEVVLVPGDMILGNGYNCQERQPAPHPAAKQFSYWRQVMKPVYDSGARVLPVRGNHEMDKDNQNDHGSCRKKTPVENVLLTAYRASFSDPYLPDNGPATQKGLSYSFRHRNALFVALDQLQDQFETDESWFEGTISDNKRSHLFVFGHYPAFVVKHTDSLDCYPQARDRFWNAIGNAGGRVYFCGHDHLYDRASIPDAKGHLIQQVLIGNGGAPFAVSSGGYPDPKVVREEHIENSYGYMVVTVKGDEVSARLKVLDPQGVWRNADAFSYLRPRR